MDEELIDIITEENIEVADAEIVEVEVNTEDVEYDVSAEEAIELVEVEPVEEIEIEVDEAIGWVGGDSTRHYSLLGRDDPNQHPITAITGLREELDSIEALQTVYSDKKGNADYYEWADGHAIGENGVGYFVTLNKDARTISICTGDDIFGVVVDSAAFVGGQDDVARDDHYGLVVTSGAVLVRCELDVAEDDYVVSNAYGWATKSNSGRGYKVVALHNINDVPYVIINLNISADQIDLMGAELQDLDSRMKAAESNIVSAVNVANEAYQMATKIGVSNKDMSDNVNDALGTVDKVVSDVESLGIQVSNSALISAQARAIAESAVTSAESMRNEAVEKANEALTDTSKLRDEFEALATEIDTDLGDAVSELEDLKKDLEPLAIWPEGSDVENATGVAGFVARADEDSATLASMVEWKGDAGESLAGFVQEATEENATIKALASYEQKDANGNVIGTGASGLISQVDANKASIEAVAKLEGDGYTGLAGLVAQVDANKAELSNIASHTYTDANGTTKTGLAAIDLQVTDQGTAINQLASWQDDTNIAMARIEQKADANGAYIQSTVSNMDKYSVGPYSQAYGFTLEQAASVLEEGMIYVPTTSHTEEYKYDDNKQTYTRTFTPQYLYKWGKIGSRYGWITVDKNYSETTETNTSAKAVYFTTTVPAVSGNFGYWYTDGDEIAEGYEAHTLYKWSTYATKDNDGNDTTDSCWTPVATLAGNSQSRAVSQIRQDANSIEISVTDMKGDVASSKNWIDENSTNIQNVVTWSKDTETGKLYDLATIKQTANEAGADIALVVEQKDGNKVINAASIVTAVNDSGSSVVIEADHLQFSGESFNVAISGPINNAVDNIQIGGTNLLINTNGNEDITLVGSSARVMGVDSYSVESGVLTLNANSSTNEIYYRFMNPGVISMYTLEAGGTYTISGKVKITTSGGSFTSLNIRSQANASDSSLSHSWFGGINTPIATADTEDWVYFAETFTIEENAVGYYLSFQLYYDSNYKGIIRFSELKLESGNKATAWSPAPEDMVGVNNVIACINASEEEGVLIKGEKINIAGNTTFTSLSNTLDGLTTTENNTTVIDGGKIKTNTITADKIATDALHSENYVSGETDTLVPSDGYSTTGTFFDLSSGAIYAPYFHVTTDGEIGATSGKIGGWSLSNLGLYYGGTNIGYTGIRSDRGSHGLPSLVNSDINSYPKFYAAAENAYGNSGLNGAERPPFVVLEDGSLYASAVKLGDGTLGSNESIFLSTTDMGGVDGFFDGTSITNWRMTVGSRFGVTNDGSLYASAVKLGDGTLGSDNSIRLSTTDMRGRLGSAEGGLNVAKTNWRMTVGSNFGVTSDGSLYASAGKIGGWDISSNALENYSGTSSVSGSSTFYANSFCMQTAGNGAVNALAIGECSPNDWSSAAFRVTVDGKVYAKAIEVPTGGSINFETEDEYSSLNSEKLYISSSTNTLVDGRYYSPNVLLRPDVISFSARSSSGTAGTNVNVGAIESMYYGTSRYVSLTGTWKGTSGTAITSDANLKNHIEYLDNRYDVLFDNILSRRFKYNDGTSERYHTGYIAQEVQSALETSNVDESEFAALCTFSTGTDEEYMGLRYSEFVALNTWQIQKLKARTTELETKIAELEAKLKD